MSQVIDLFSRDEEEERKSASIDFCYSIDNDSLPISALCAELTIVKPSDYDYVSLVSEGESFDVMVAWDVGDGPFQRVTYIGHWNDGVIRRD